MSSSLLDCLARIEKKLDILLRDHGLAPDGTWLPDEDEMADAADAELDKIKRDLQAAVTRPHPVAPAPDAIVFGPDMREIAQPWEGIPADRDEPRYPLLSTCTCGRQITMIAAGTVWAYCGA